MARTPLASRLRDAAAVASEASARGVTTNQVLEERAARPRRREILAGGAGLAVAAAFGSRMSTASAATAPRIVVVGAGLAGLTCAYRLKQAGFSAQIHEASDRLGGRCWTLRDTFANGQIAEHGGELIDQNHTEIRQLAQELGLDLDNLPQGEANGTEDFYYFNGQPYSFAEATDDLKDIWQQIHTDVSATSYPTLFNLSTQRGRELDQMSVADYIETYVPGGLASNLGQLLDLAYNIEYGADTSVQSSLNLLYLLAFSGQGQLRIFGPSNEKYHVRGGNDQITTRLANALTGQIKLGSESRRDQEKLEWQLRAHLQAQRRRQPLGHRRPRGAGASLLDPPHGQLFEGRLLGAEADRDSGAGNGHELETAPAVH
jgi:monoamine oxidase